MLRAIDNFAHNLGWFVIVAAVIAAYIYLCVMSPLLRWITAQLAMAAWGLATIGTGFFVAWRQAHDDEWAGAIGALLGGAFLAIPWVFAAREFYPDRFPPKSEALKLWS